MAGVKGMKRKSKYSEETPEEKKIRMRKYNREYQRGYHKRKKAEREQLALQIAKEEYKTEIKGGN